MYLLLLILQKPLDLLSLNYFQSDYPSKFDSVDIWLHLCFLLPLRAAMKLQIRNRQEWQCVMTSKCDPPVTFGRMVQKFLDYYDWLC